jgi:hypothetical protein
MTAINSSSIEHKPEQRSLWRDLLQAARLLPGRPACVDRPCNCGDRRWPLAAGLAPLVLALLPCAAMCTLHLCMRPGGEGHCKKDIARDEPHLLPAPSAERRTDGNRS